MKQWLCDLLEASPLNRDLIMTLCLRSGFLVSVSCISRSLEHDGGSLRLRDVLEDDRCSKRRQDRVEEGVDKVADTGGTASMSDPTARLSR